MLPLVSPLQFCNLNASQKLQLGVLPCVLHLQLPLALALTLPRSLSLSLFVFFCVFRLPAMGDLQLIAELHNCAFPCIFLSQRRVWGKGGGVRAGVFGGFGGCIFSFNSLGICYLLPVSIAHEVLLLLLLLLLVLLLLFIMGHILSLENGVLSRSAQLMHVSAISLARAAQFWLLLHSLAGTVTHISQVAKKRSCLIN